MVVHLVVDLVIDKTRLRRLRDDTAMRDGADDLVSLINLLSSFFSSLLFSSFVAIAVDDK